MGLCTPSAHHLHALLQPDSAVWWRPQRLPRSAPMNTPGTPKPSWRQRNVLLTVAAVLLAIVLILLFVPW